MTKHHNTGFLVFALVTLIYLGTRWFIFIGFNGTDDLHYAMLSSNLVKHQFDPFVPVDILSGRYLLIAIQAFIYRLAGISILTTQAGTFMATMAACYLTVFKLLKSKDSLQILFSASLFYFSPVLYGSTLGIMPDAYVLLFGIFILLLTNELVNKTKKDPVILKSLLLGMLIGLTLLIKEITIVFLPFCIIMMFVSGTEAAFRKIIFIGIGFSIIVTVIGLYYYYGTGNFFFKIVQINSSDYQHSFKQSPGVGNTLIRMTYGPWKVFVVQGFYPLVFGILSLLIALSSRNKALVKNHFFAVSFIILILLTLYLPFSLQDFSLLPVESRHFAFLIPLAVLLSAEFFYPAFIQTRNSFIPLVFIAAMVVCILNTGNKWQWMIYILFAVFFTIIRYVRLQPFFSVLCICSLLWLSITDAPFFKKDAWFAELQTLNKGLPDGRFYFIDHDNYMHWQLLRRFDNIHNTYFNLEKKPFYIFENYYPDPRKVIFKPGWLIINKSYPGYSNKLLSALEPYKIQGNEQLSSLKFIDLIYVDSQKTLDDVKSAVQSE